MKIFLLATNHIGYEITKYLVKKDDNIIGLGLISENDYTCKIIAASKLKNNRIFFLKEKIDKSFIKKIKKLEPDYILSVGWPYILKHNFYTISLKGSLNFHLSYLPYNKGKNPNVWPIIDCTFAGVSIHYIDSGIDSGDIIVQEKVKIEPIDTAKTLHKKLNLKIVKMFKKNWIKIKEKKFNLIHNNPNKGSFHSSKEFQALSEINLNKKIFPLDLINILRAKSYPPHPSAYIVVQGKKIYIDISLKYKKNNE